MTAKVPLIEPSAVGGESGAVGTPARSILVGMIGSIMMVIGSMGVGWLAVVSPLRQWPPIIYMRFYSPGVVISVILLAVGGMLLVRSWLRLGQKLHNWEPQSQRSTLAAIAAWGGPMLLAIPLFSRDVYAYIIQGKVVLSGLNPYKDGYAQISNYFQSGADELWSQSPTPYGPVFLWMEQFVVWLTGDQQELAILLFRGAALIGIVLCIIYVPKLAELHGMNPHRALWLTAANPLFLINFIASVHNDALMLGLALAGLYYAATKKPLLAILLITLSIGIKPITVVFLPFIGLLWAGQKAGWPRKFVYWAMTAGLSFALLAIMGWINGYGFGWVGALSTPGSVWIWYAPIGLLGMVLGLIATGLSLDGDVAANVVHVLGTIAAVVVVLWLALFGEHSRIIRRLALAFAAIVLLAPMIQSWYVVWLIPLFAATGIRNDWQVKALYFIVSFFMVYAIVDQLDVFAYIAVNLNIARLIAGAIAVCFALYLVFVDPRTKLLFRKKYDAMPAHRTVT